MGFDELAAGDEDAVAVAHHEAGHAVAATLCGVRWKSASMWEDRGGHGGVTRLDHGHLGDTAPASVAFIFWAGSWAHARYLSPCDPWQLLAWVQEEHAGFDMGTVWDYWSDPAQAPHETEEQWARELDSVWGSVEALAERLAVRWTLPGH